MKTWVPAVYLGIYHRKWMWGGGESEAGKEDRLGCCCWQWGSALWFTPEAHRVPLANIHPREGGVTSYPHISVGSGLPLVVAAFWTAWAQLSMVLMRENPELNAEDVSKNSSPKWEGQRKRNLLLWNRPSCLLPGHLLQYPQSSCNWNSLSLTLGCPPSLLKFHSPFKALTKNHVLCKACFPGPNSSLWLPTIVWS